MDTASGQTVSAHEITSESALHGRIWSSLYDGYFSDPARLAPLLAEVEWACRERPPDALVDLGGGTGFILDQASRSEAVPRPARLIVVDLSERQLGEIRNPRLEGICQSMLDVRRSDLALDDRPVLWISRSTLHYAGVFGLKPVLRHVRTQMRQGEFFVHQSLACARPEDALLLDELMERLGSGKWVPPVASMETCAREAGLAVARQTAAPPLRMGADILAERYHHPADQVVRILEMLAAAYPQSPLIRADASGLAAWAPYWVYTCCAV
jgi:hypothetical protein